MGTDKAALIRGRDTLLEQTVKLLEGLGLDVHVSISQSQARDPLRRRFEVIVDTRGDLGPGAGLLSAHAEFPDHAWLIVACDLPRLNRAVLAGLLEARDPGAGATAYRGEGEVPLEPLCAIYEPDTLARFADRVTREGSPSPTDLLQDSELNLLSYPGDALTNVNSPEDLQRIGMGRRNE